MRALLLFLLICLSGCRQAPDKRLIVLGLDGCDPKLLQRFIDEGKLPHFQRLQQQGSFHPLETSNPAQSPVAWATFITGLDPGGHGLFDFIHRDPESMAPVSSMSEVDDGGKAHLLRKGRPFWEHLEAAGIPATLLKIPVSFPPPRAPGRLLSGMGTPDLEGSYGTFSYYTAADEEPPTDLSGGRFVPVKAVQGVVRASLVGPENEAAPLRVHLQGASALVVIGEEQRLLKKGEWSDWIPVSFPSAQGIVRLYLKDTEPHLKLYASPVNINPYDPVQPITNPAEFSRHLCRHCGYFYTQGMPEDTKALLHGVLDDSEFLAQSGLVVQEHRKLFEHGLSEFKSGLYFFYLSAPDIASHMYWNTIDGSHPGYRDERASLYSDVILQAYQEADFYVGRALQQVDEKTALLVLSDHGFAPFHRSFNLNAWLAAEGYLNSLASAPTPDWPSTRLYGAGFNGLYVNQIGRESVGIVEQAAREELLQEVSSKLLALQDPQTGQPVVRSIYRSDQIYSEPYRDSSPDLVLGYSPGYRAAWQSVLAQTDGPMFEDNLTPWSGDHMVDPACVPGILLSDRKLTNQADLVDIAPTILAYFEVGRPREMKGTSLWLDSDEG